MRLLTKNCIARSSQLRCAATTSAIQRGISREYTSSHLRCITHALVSTRL